MKKKIIQMISVITTVLISLVSLTGCVDFHEEYQEKLEKLRNIQGLEGYRIVTEDCLIENGTVTDSFLHLMIEELEKQEISLSSSYHKHSYIYYNNLMYYCFFNEQETTVYFAIIDPSDKQVTVIYTLDSATIDGGKIWAANLYAATEESYVFYAYIENTGYWYFIFDKTTNQLIEQTKKLSDEYTMIEGKHLYRELYRCESFILNGKEYAVETDPWEGFLYITALDYELKISINLVKNNVPEIFEIFTPEDNTFYTGSWFFYEDYFYFVYYNNIDDNWGGKTWRYTVPQLVFRLDVEEKTVEYIGFSENDYTRSNYLYDRFGYDIYCVVGIAKIK